MDERNLDGCRHFGTGGNLQCNGGLPVAPKTLIVFAWTEQAFYEREEILGL